MEVWQTWKTTLNMPKLCLTSFFSLSRAQKTMSPKILKIWDTPVEGAELKNSTFFGPNHLGGPWVRPKSNTVARSDNFKPDSSLAFSSRQWGRRKLKNIVLTQLCGWNWQKDTVVNASTKTILRFICSEGYFEVYFPFGDYFRDYFWFGDYFWSEDYFPEKIVFKIVFPWKINLKITPRANGWSSLHISLLLSWMMASKLFWDDRARSWGAFEMSLEA